MFKKVLVANRGEIAVRIMRTLREMDIAPVAVWSSADQAALHVRMAAEAVHIGPEAASESYLRVDRIVAAAKRSGAEAIHPGYGFLSENPLLADACEAEGITFIGPPAAAMRAMSRKPDARETMARAGVPVVPGGPASTLEEGKATALLVGYPIMLKAASGGGGKGMRLVASEAELALAWESARSVAEKSFGDATVYIEKAIVRPRHVEIQVLGDTYGHLVHLFERDCSIQRRHQKVIEETPCPSASAELVARMGDIAVRGAAAVGYHSAGTFEFLLGEDGSFYFLEMNTRLQVEHPVTEWVTGIDLVREMVRIAAGERLGYRQEDVVRRGASIECRIYAEDPEQGFLPSPGKITGLAVPHGPGIRDDSGIYQGSEVSSAYDPLLSKLSVWAADRPQAIARMRRALREYVVAGVRTNLAFHDRTLAHAEFAEGTYDTGFIERHRDTLLRHHPSSPEEERQWLAALAVRYASERSAPKAAPPPLSPWLAAHRAKR